MSRKNIDQALRISSLIMRYLRNELTDDEWQELDDWLNASDANQALLKKLFSKSIKQQYRNTGREFDTQKGFENLLVKINASEQKAPKRLISMRASKWLAAACLTIALGYGGYMLSTSNRTSANERSLPVSHVHANNNAVKLTLADGATVDVDAQHTGTTAKLGNNVITKSDAGSLSYSVNSTTQNNDESSTALNVLDVPRGKQFQLALPDGSKVWLNAQSKLSFPTRFGKKERVVKLTGEAYFEVAHAANWPFKVETEQQTVQVLGTKFNISAYPENHQTVTTLATGSVKVFDERSYQLLVPGQMAVKAEEKPGFTITSVDVDDLLAWRSGILVFKDADVTELMRTIRRTFNVEVEVDEHVKEQHFGGSYHISKGLPNLLKNLEQTNVIHFKVKDGRVKVMP
jgi:transmembrane sensor